MARSYSNYVPMQSGVAQLSKASFGEIPETFKSFDYIEVLIVAVDGDDEPEDAARSIAGPLIVHFEEEVDGDTIVSELEVVATASTATEFTGATQVLLDATRARRYSVSSGAITGDPNSNVKTYLRAVESSL